MGVFFVRFKCLISDYYKALVNFTLIYSFHHCQKNSNLQDKSFYNLSMND